MEKKYTHSGIVLSLTGKFRVKLRETRTMWISSSGQRFRKGAGFIVGDTYPRHQLGLSSIKELAEDDK